jgi:excisionase family DNA binding protein
MQTEIPKLAYPIADACVALGITRNRAYQAIADGSLQTYKDGRRRMVSRRALQDYVDRKERAGGEGGAP